MTNRSAIVTGSSGFVAGHLIEQLVQDGYSVTGIDLTKKNQSPTYWTEFTEDLRDFEKIRSILKKNKPDIVFHLAAQTSVAISSREPVADVVHNVEASVGLAQIVADLETPRFVFTSTGGAMYGEKSHPPYTEQTVDVNINVVSNLNKLSFNYFPKTVKVKFLVSVDNYIKINPIDFKIECYVNDILKNDYPLVVVKKPEMIKNISLSTEKIQLIMLE